METHLPPLILDLVLILTAGAVMTLLFRYLKQPVVLGYLIAGFLISPHFPYLPGITDEPGIQIWSELGIIFMLFGLGLEFSFKKLAHVGKTAGMTAAVEIVLMILLGFFVGKILAWDTMNSLFLGVILSMSSTTIIVKAFDEQHLKGRTFAPIVFSVLIVEDLLAVLLLVLLATVAVSNNFSGTALLLESGKLVFFLILWFVAGIYLLPAFLRMCRKLFTDEILLIVSLSLCLLMVMLAVSVGFSAALGAFVMGSLLAETSKGAKIEHLTLPIKDLFAAIFFVSVGMLIDPAIIVRHWQIILLIIAVTIVGKFFATASGAVLSGCNLKHAMQTGMSMAQIGEFSFIIAALGNNLGVIEDFMYPITVAVSAMTTFTTPYLIKSSGTLTNYLHSRIPASIHRGLQHYETSMNRNGKEGVLKLLWRVYGVRILLNSVIVIGITVIVRFVSQSFSGLGNQLLQAESTPMGNFLCLVTLALSAPFLRTVFYQPRPCVGAFEASELATLLRLHIGVTVFRFFFGILLLYFIAGHFVSVYSFSILTLIPLILLVVLLWSKRLEKLYHRIERQFIVHLTEKEREAVAVRTQRSGLPPWDISLTEFVVSQHSPLIGKSLQDSELKARFGVTAVMIERGGTMLIPPQGSDLLLPFDRVYLIGTDRQLAAVQHIIEKKMDTEVDFDDDYIGLESLVLHSHHPFVGKSVRECGLREAVNGLIVGIERQNVRHLNPDPRMVFQEEDVLWLVGDKGLIKRLRKSGG
ncbi:MAG: cation:proton antiporter [Planctomycetaceae bacterium]|jgi:CPA2 family monovalent cation:H+ antiporter-2|nr:cation:proton antiporter [Planctomycetaceae bacterium]